MENTIKVLAVLLGLQLVFAVWLGYSGTDPVSGVTERTALVELAREKVDRITLEGPGADKVVLEQGDDDWQLASQGGFPANPQRVDALLTTLAQLSADGVPVATSAAARDRFRVSASDFERRIVLGRGDETLVTLYLGSSPGRGRIHARVDGEDAISVVEMAAFDVPLDAVQWQDNTLLQLAEQSIAGLKVAGLELRRQPVSSTDEETDAVDSERPATYTGVPWQVEGLADGQVLKVDAVDKLGKLIAELETGAVLGKAPQQEYGLSDSVLELSVIREGDSEVRYRLGKRDGKAGYVLKASSRPEYFALPDFKAQALLEAAARDSLVATASTPSGETATVADSPSSDG